MLDFMFGLLLENKTAAEAASKLTALKEKLERCGFSFGNVCPVLLADNGGEFSCIAALENEADGARETSRFFCAPNALCQKPHVENNHSFLRSIVPSGTSFDGLSQETVDLIFSHVNSVIRRLFNGKSTYETYSFADSENLEHALGVSFVEPRKVIQSPLLLKQSARG